MNKKAKTKKGTSKWAYLLLYSLLAEAFIGAIYLASHSTDYFWIEIDAEPKTAAVGDIINLNICVYGDSVSITEFDEVLVGLDIYSRQDNIENVRHLGLVRILRDSFDFNEGEDLPYLSYDVSVFVDNQGWENTDTALFTFGVEAISTTEGYHGSNYASVAVDLRG